MVVLSARSTDAAVNKLAPSLFQTYPNIESLLNISPEALYPYIKSIPGFMKKAKYLLEIAQAVRSETGIPRTIDEFLKLSGVGRKTANVVMFEMDLPAEGVIVDLHTIRVTGRLGIVNTDKSEKIERRLMEVFPAKDWGLLGMSLTYIGRELCRPTDPHCFECPLSTFCNYNQLDMKKRTTKV